MSKTSNRSPILKRYARLVLALFVLSVLNLSFQMPAHAAMMQDMSQNQMSDMMQADMQNCHCPPVLCESVLALEEQTIENSFSLSFENLLSFYPATVEAVDTGHLQTIPGRLAYLDRQYRQSSPPPLSITSILHI